MQTTKSLVIYGAGGHGKVVADAAYKSGWFVLGFVDEKLKVKDTICGFPVIADSLEGLIWSLSEIPFGVIVAIGDNMVRMKKIEQLLSMGIPVVAVIHPDAVISTYSGVQAGALVCAGAVVNTHSVVGVGAIINTGATIDHDSLIGNYAHIGPGVHMGGNVSVEEGALVSIGCSVRDKINIGKWSIVGVGSVVVKDIPNNVVAYGCPAKVQKEL